MGEATTSASGPRAMSREGEASGGGFDVAADASNGSARGSYPPRPAIATASPPRRDDEPRVRARSRSRSASAVAHRAIAPSSARSAPLASASTRAPRSSSGSARSRGSEEAAMPSFSAHPTESDRVVSFRAVSSAFATAARAPSSGTRYASRSAARRVAAEGRSFEVAPSSAEVRTVRAPGEDRPPPPPPLAAPLRLRTSALARSNFSALDLMHSTQGALLAATRTRTRYSDSDVTMRNWRGWPPSGTTTLAVVRSMLVLGPSLLLRRHDEDARGARDEPALLPPAEVAAPQVDVPLRRVRGLAVRARA